MNTSNIVFLHLLLLLPLTMLVKMANCDINQDKNECASQLVGLSTCLSYVGGQAKTPTIDCCTGLNQLLKSNKKCLCVLIKDKDDPSLGLKINSTLALGLPLKCNSPDHDVSVCPSLLHLAPNSPEAKVFTEVAKGAPASPASASKPGDSTSAPTTKAPANGGVRNTWLAASPQMLYGLLLLWCFTFLFVF